MVQGKEEERKMTGLLCFVYRSNHQANLNGITGDQVILCGAGIPKIFDASEDCPAVVLERKSADYVCAKPQKALDAGYYLMFGGNFIYTTDSRFPAQYPIPLHDRWEF